MVVTGEFAIALSGSQPGMKAPRETNIEATDAHRWTQISCDGARGLLWTKDNLEANYQSPDCCTVNFTGVLEFVPTVTTKSCSPRGALDGT